MQNFLEDAIEDDLINKALEESNFKSILTTKAEASLKKYFEKVLRDASFEIVFNSKSKQLEIEGYVESNEGKIGFTKSNSLQDVFEFGSFFDSIGGVPEEAHQAGEFFKAISDKCFEIEKEDSE